MGWLVQRGYKEDVVREQLARANCLIIVMIIIHSLYWVFQSTTILAAIS